MSSWPGTSQSSCHNTGISTCCAHQWIHSAVLWGQGLGFEVCWGSSSSLSPVQGASSPAKKSWMKGLRAGEHLRSSSYVLGSGLDQSDGSAVPSLSPQVRRGGSSPLTSSPRLSSKVTYCLHCTGLGDWAHLLVCLPWCDSAWGTLAWWLTFQDLWWHVPECLCLLNACGSMSASYCSWVRSLTFLSCLPASLWVPMLADGHPSQQLGPPYRNFTYYPLIIGSWPGSGCYIWPGSHISGHWLGSSLAMWEPTDAGVVPWWHLGSLGGEGPLSPHHGATSQGTFIAGIHPHKFQQSPPCQFRVDEL